MRKEISEEKLLEMIRSILPSTAREWARRKKAGVKRRARRTVRQSVQQYDEESSVDLLREPDLRNLVDGRRAYGKLNHFMRWCEQLTKGMTKAQKLDYVRAFLPKTVIGDHAYVHWKYHCEIGRRRRTLSIREYVERQQQSLYDKTRHALRAALTADPSLLGELNAEIKRRKSPDEPRRLLLGMHDVDAFVHEVLIGRTWSRCEEQDALRSLKVIE